MHMQYRNIDCPKQPQRVRIEWSRVVTNDLDNPRPDEHDDGFWPSEDPDDAGYIGAGGNIEEAYALAKARMEAWERGDWSYVGVQARAQIFVPIGGGSFTQYELLSAGLWSIESDSGEYLEEVYEDEKASLQAHLRAICEAITDLL